MSEEELKKQLEIIAIKINNNDFDDIFNIYESFPESQKEIIEFLIKVIQNKIEEKDYDTALTIGKYFEDNASIQSKMVTIYKKRKKYSEAEKIGKRFPEDPIIQSKMIDIAIEKKHWDKAKKIATRIEMLFPQDLIIKSQIITIEIKLSKLEKAKEIANETLQISQDFGPIQSQLITIALIEGRLDDAKKICDRFPNNLIIQLQMIDIVLLERRFEDAKTACKKLIKLNPNDTKVRKKMDKILLLTMEHKKTLDFFKTYLYCNKFDENIFKYIEESLYLTDFEKAIISLAFFERFKKVISTLALEKYDASGIMSDKEKTQIKQIKQRVLSNPKIFNFHVYDSILHWNINYNLVRKFEVEETSNINFIFNQYFNSLNDKSHC